MYDEQPLTVVCHDQHLGTELVDGLIMVYSVDLSGTLVMKKSRNQCGFSLDAHP